ncbi:MAG TPA: tetratricopeptide repeat protein [Pirellulales bacterium]|jgi:tetratricopeptide (TPR) repeat protein|nr:tetratricopeptide repeat protein [Pirellulales bacterium]
MGTCHHALGYLLYTLGENDLARAEYERALAIRGQLTAEFSDVAGYQSDLARTHNNLGMLLEALRQGDEARAEYNESLKIVSKLAERFPDISAYLHQSATTRVNLGALFYLLGKWDEAGREYAQAQELFRKLVERFPACPSTNGTWRRVITTWASSCRNSVNLRKAAPSTSARWKSKRN